MCCAEDDALLGLAGAFSDADQDGADQPDHSINAITSDGRTVRQCRQDRQDNCLTEPCTGIRYRCEVLRTRPNFEHPECFVQCCCKRLALNAF
jgi:hypothetical protein